MNRRAFLTGSSAAALAAALPAVSLPTIDGCSLVVGDLVTVMMDGSQAWWIERVGTIIYGDPDDCPVRFDRFIPRQSVGWEST